MKNNLWETLDKEVQDNLIEWYNSQPDNDEKEMLAQLYLDGNFTYWECPICGKDIRIGNPDNWNEYQGVHNPETLGQLCGDCGYKYLKLKEYAEE